MRACVDGNHVNGVCNEWHFGHVGDELRFFHSRDCGFGCDGGGYRCMVCEKQIPVANDIRGMKGTP